MGQRLLVIIAVAAFAVGIYGTAEGTPITYDFQGTNTGKHDLLQQTQSGVTVDVTAYSITYPSNIRTLNLITGSGLGVYDGSSGLGVKAYSGDGSDIDGSNETGGSDVDEGLLFDLPGEFRILGVFFVDVGSSDDFGLDVDGVIEIVDEKPNPLGLTSLRDAWYMLMPNGYDLSGNSFFISADGNSDDFRIGKLMVEAVPEPSTMLLFGIGLAGAGYFVSRKKKS